MVVKHCVYRDCESDSRYWDRDYMKGVCFIRFPNPSTHRDRCLKWVMACDRRELTITCVDDKTYICSKHFIGGNGPTKESADPLSPKQLSEVNTLNQMSINSDTNRTHEMCTESEDTNSYMKSNNNLFIDMNCPQNSETEYITEILNKKQSIINENSIQSSDEKTIFNTNISNQSPFTTTTTTEPNVIDIDSSDSNDENNESVNESLLVPTLTSNGSPMTTQLMSNENKYNTNSTQEVINNSLPLIIIPSNNQIIGSSFSVPIMPLSSDKNWFKNIIENEFCLKLSIYGLSFGRIGQRLTFSSIQGSVVEKQLIVDISGHFDVKVFGLSISAKNNFYKSVPNIIENELQFNSVIDLFSKWKVCIANEITEPVFEDKIIAIRGFVCNITNSIRSRNCELLLPDIPSIRCKFCRILLNRIRKFKYSLQTNV